MLLLSPFEGGHHYCHYPYHSSGQTTGREYSPTHQQKIGLRFTKHGLPTNARPSFPHSQSLPSGSLHQPLILIHQRADRMGNTVTENKLKWLHGSQPCVTQWNSKPCHVGPPKTVGSWWRALTKCGPLETEMANDSAFLPWDPIDGMKRHKNMTLKDGTPQVGRCPVFYWRVEKQLWKEWRGWTKEEMIPSGGCVWWWK